MKERQRRSAQPESTPDWRTLFASLANTAHHPDLVKYYQAGAVAADTPLNEVPLMALDMETTGLDAKKHAILSFGLVPMDLARIRCQGSLYRVVKPPSELISESVTFHRITHSDIETAPRLIEVLDELLEAMAGKVMVVHYRNIERAFLDQALRHYLGEGIHFPVIDTMDLEARIHPRQKTGLFNWLLRRQPESIRLADSRSRYGLPQYQSHHALTDALATAELLQAQVATHFRPDIPVRELWR
ncbi:3'-5' exonuclease [Pseudomonas saliphila]|uniref:3'-5' exonuclease n=1 Tax=Pseudomonas saliphila TaxID=2586906 RepID=UPI0012392A74|nr:3'-5' exonuclease [Pseudomonas saliphila]